MSLASSDDAQTLDPLAGIDLDALIRGGARSKPDRLAMTDVDGDALDCAMLDARVDTMARRLVDLGLAPGETLMIVGATRLSTFLGMLAGLRAGLDVALAPVHPAPTVLALFAARAGASAIATEADASGDMESIYEVAARAPDVRFVCELGATAADGVVALGGPAEEFDDRGAAFFTPTGRIATFAPGGGLVYHGQRTLALAALDLATRVPGAQGAPILTTIAPTSFAGLVAGPFLSLILGRPLHFHGPFEPEGFIGALEKLAPAHLVAPGALAGPLAEGDMIRADLLASLMLLDRTTEARGALAPLGEADGVAVIDLHAFGEQALIAEARGPDKRPLPPARAPHMIRHGDASILAVRRRDGTGPLAFEGEAVSAG